MLPAPPPSVRGEAHPPPSPAGTGAGAPRPPAPPRSSTAARRTRWLLAGAPAAGCAYIAVADPNSSSSLYPQCPFKAMTGWDCPGCGITRAIHALLTGHPVRALDHNVLVVTAAVLALVWFGVGWVRRRQGRPPLQLRHPTAWAVALGVVVLAFWVLRNIPWGPFRWLGSGAAGA